MSKPQPEDSKKQADQLLKDADQQIKKVMKEAQSRFDEARDFIKKECADIANILSKCSKSYKKDVKEFELNWEDVRDKAEDFDEFSSAIENMTKVLKTSGLAITAKQLTGLVNTLASTGASIEDLADCLYDNLAFFDDDIRAMSVKLKDLDEEAKDSISKMVERAKKLGGNIDAANEVMGKTLDSTSDKADKVNKLAEKAKKEMEGIKFFKTDPRKVSNDLKVIHKLTEKEAKSLVVKFGFDSESEQAIINELAEVAKEMDEQSTHISDLMENMTDENADQLQKDINKRLQIMASQAAHAKKYLNTQKENALEQQEIVRVASQGFFGLAESAQKASDSFKDGLNDLRRLDFTGAKSSFSNALKQLSVLNKAGKAVGSTTPGILGKLAMFSRGILLIGGVAAALIAFLALLNQARDQAVELNKSLISAGGLAGLGFDLKANVSPKQIREKLMEVRNEIHSFGKGMFDYAVDSKEVAQVLEELGKQGVTVDELRQKGTSARDAVKGVFTYARLLGKTDTEMASIMGEMATTLNLSMDQVESRFADLSNRWQGSRISIDQFIGTVKEISSQHSVFGDYMNETSKLLEKTGKNAVLSSEQAIAATKASAGVLESFDAGKIRAVVEAAGGGDGKAYMARIYKKEESDLVKQLEEAKAKGGKNIQTLEQKLRRIRSYIDATTGANEAGIDYTQGIHEVSIGRQNEAFFRYAQHVAGVSDQELKQAKIYELSSAGKIGQRMQKQTGTQAAEWDNLVATAASVAGGYDKSAYSIFEALDNSNNLIGDMTKQVEDNNKKAKDLSTNLLTSEKAMAIATEGLLSKLYGIVNAIEDMVEKIANFNPFGWMKGGGGGSAHTDAKVGAGIVGDMTIANAPITGYLNNLAKLATDKSVNEGKFKEEWEKIPENIRKQVEQIASGDTSSIKDYEMDDTALRDLVVKSAQTLERAKKSGAKSAITGKDIKLPTSAAALQKMSEQGVSARMLSRAFTGNLSTDITGGDEFKTAKGLQQAVTGSGTGVDSYTNATRAAVDVGKSSKVYTPVSGTIKSVSANGVHIIPDMKNKKNSNSYALFMNTKDFTTGKKSGDKIRAGDEIGNSHRGYKIVLAAFRIEAKRKLEIGFAQLLKEINQKTEYSSGLKRIANTEQGSSEAALDTSAKSTNASLLQQQGNVGSTNYDTLIQAMTKVGDSVSSAPNTQQGGAQQGTRHDFIKTNKYNFNITVDDKKLVRSLRRSIEHNERLKRFKKTYFA